MKTLFKTSDVLRFLYNFDCNLTAEDIKNRSKGAEFLDSKFVKSKLNKEIYGALVETYNQYTYKN